MGGYPPIGRDPASPFPWRRLLGSFEDPASQKWGPKSRVLEEQSACQSRVTCSVFIQPSNNQNERIETDPATPHRADESGRKIFLLPWTGVFSIRRGFPSTCWGLAYSLPGTNHQDPSASSQRSRRTKVVESGRIGRSSPPRNCTSTQARASVSKTSSRISTPLGRLFSKCARSSWWASSA